MKKISWIQELSIGNDDIDKDHQLLLEIYNDMVEQYAKNQNRVEFAKLLSRMTDYALSHFRKEEQYMHEMEYPNLETHIKYHLEYNKRVAEFNYNLLVNSPTKPHKVLSFLQEWWTSHIQNEDAKYETYKKKNNSEAIYGLV